MDETKKWWQSRTIWFGLLTAISAVISSAASGGALPASWALILTAGNVDKIVTAGLWIATLVFRILAHKKITFWDILPSASINKK
jgi:predicted membrane-bound dolichyl-phosphate-mannose-protein mannosyltransferase